MVQDLKNALDLHVVVGGKQATVFYAGPSGFGGVDQLNFEIPADVVEGCFVPFVMWANDSRSKGLSANKCINCSEIWAGCYSSTRHESRPALAGSPTFDGPRF